MSTNVNNLTLLQELELMKKQEQEDLASRQLKRKACFLKYEEELNVMRDVKKGTRYRKWLFLRLKHFADHVFENEDVEYQAIGKFYRGMWYNVSNTFKRKEEMEFIEMIANEYGAFDY